MVKKLAKAFAIVVLIAAVAIYALNNWGNLADSAVNFVGKTVTGKDIGFDGFGNANSGTPAQSDPTW